MTQLISAVNIFLFALVWLIDSKGFPVALSSQMKYQVNFKCSHLHCSCSKSVLFNLTSGLLCLFADTWILYLPMCKEGLSLKVFFFVNNVYILLCSKLKKKKPKHDLRPILTCRTRNSATQKISATRNHNTNVYVFLK